MAEKRVIELEVKTESVGNLKAELRKAQAEVTALSEKFGATSQEAINAAKKAAALKDAIADAKALTDAYNPDAKFNALSQSIGGVLNGFQAFEGALGLVGVQSKDVEEALLAVNSAMALSQGVTGVLESVDSFKTLATQVSNLTIVQKLSTAAQWLWNAAMNANPLGAIVIAITAVIAAGYKLISFFQESAAENERMSKSIDRNSAALKRQEQQIQNSASRQKEYNSFQYEYAKASGASAEQLRKLAIKHQEEELALANKNKELAKSTYLRQQDILATMMANDADEELIEKQKEVVKQARENATKAREAAVQENKELVALKRQQLVEIRQEQTDANKKEQEAAKEAAEKRREAAKEANEKQREDRKKAAEDKAKFDLEQIELEEKRQEQAYQRKLDADAKAAEEEKAQEDKYRAEQLAAEEADEKRQEEAWKKKQEDRFKNAEGYLQAEITQNENNFKAKLDLLELQRQKELENIELTEGEKVAIEAKYAEASKQIQQQRIDLILKYAQTFGNAMGALSNLLNAQDNERLKNVKKGSKEEEAIKKKMFERDKKLRIVQTIIDTASNVVQSVRNGGGIPAGIPFGVAAGVMGALQIAAIKKTSFDAGGGEQPPASGGAGSSGAAAANVITPNFNVVGNAQATNPLAGLGGQPIQAYVVSGEVTTAQSLDRNRVNYATFG